MTNSPVDPDGRLRRPSGIRTLRLGDTTVSYVPDGAVQGRPRRWLPDTTDEIWAAHPEYLDASGCLVASIGALLVERGDHALLIDTGVGPLSLPADPETPNGAIYGGALLDSLAKLGRTPAEIDAVAFTHLHVDHVGWAWPPVPGNDQPAFAHAVHWVAESEWAQRDVAEAAGTPHEVITALEPRVRTMTGGQEILPGVQVRITAGHTPGHAEYIITSGERRLIAFGDALHTPFQVEHPEWSYVHDHDPVRAADHRRRLVAELADPGTIGFGIHFADVVFGRVRRNGTSLTWHPLDA